MPGLTRGWRNLVLRARLGSPRFCRNGWLITDFGSYVRRIRPMRQGEHFEVPCSFLNNGSIDLRSSQRITQAHSVEAQHIDVSRYSSRIVSNQFAGFWIKDFSSIRSSDHQPVLNIFICFSRREGNQASEDRNSLPELCQLGARQLICQLRLTG